MAAVVRPSARDDDEVRDILRLIAEAAPFPNAWIDTPNDLLGGRRPCDLIGTVQEDRVRELTRAIKHGMFT